MNDNRTQVNLIMHLLFGAFTGLLIGAPVGTVCCWLVGLDGFRLQGALSGSLVGTIGGLLIGLRLGKARGDLAAIICCVYGLLPALLILLGGIGAIKGKFSGVLLLGAASAGPMLGLLIGATLDRAYQECLRRAWRLALPFGAAGIACCTGIVVAMTLFPIGLDPEELAKEAKSLILQEWQNQPELKGATIQNVTLVREGGNLYTGLVHATIDGRPEQFRLKVVFENETLNLTLMAMDN